MKPVYYEPVINKYLTAFELGVVKQEQDIHRLASTCDMTSKLALTYDFNYDKLMIYVVGAAAAICLFTSFFLKTAWPIYLFCVLLAVLFISVYFIRQQRVNFLNLGIDVSKDSPSTLKDQLISTHHNLDIVKAKYWSGALVIGALFIISALCGMVILNQEINLFLSISAIALGTICSTLVHYRDLSKINKLQADFLSEVKAKIPTL